MLLAVIIWALYAEYDRPWKEYQKEFNRLEYSITSKQYQKMLLERHEVSEEQGIAADFDKKLARLKKKLTVIPNRGEKIKQLWLQDFGETDRCITCHQGVENEWFGKEPQPFKTHSGDYIKHHPVETFGCVVCHEGQGPALTADAAHGYVKNWAKPILKGPFAQSSCGKCHFMEEGLPLGLELSGGSSFIDGWKLFHENNCIGCHQLSGYKRPDHISPALTFIGDKVNRSWLVKWLKNPKDYLPNTKMPRFILGDDEINYIASYLLSRSTTQHTPTDSSPYLKNAEGKLTDVSLIKKGEKLFAELGCLGCHKINSKGIDFAPDLSDIDQSGFISF
jgi:mono/diheme cytochrome c family protein